MVNNDKKNLSSFGFCNYYITNTGKVFQIQPIEKEIKTDTANRIVLIDEFGNKKRITIKSLYKKVFEKEFCFDEIENLQGEKWLPIENTKEKYFVSNYGRVKSKCGIAAIILKPYLQKSGYLEVKIQGKNNKIHQLVANYFCENKYKGTGTKTEIHHKNKNRQDNRAENLIILSIKEHHDIHNRKETIDNV